MKKMKKGISLLLSIVMIAAVFLSVGPIALIEAEAADITIGGITQQRVVSNYDTLYQNYANGFYLGAGTNGPTNMVIPGLSSTDNYVSQGITYWDAKDWFLVSAYYNGSGKPSVISALDGTTGDFVALFRLYQADGTTPIISHVGGIGVSEYNLYLADEGKKLSYFSLEQFDVPVGTAKNIVCNGSADFSNELNGANTSYCSVEDGVLWTGNFYLSGNDSYGKKANASYGSMLNGYKLKGNSSAEEWANLQNTNTITTTTTGGTNGALTYTVSINSQGYIDLANTTSAAGSSELTYNLGTVDLTHGTKYVLEFDMNKDNFNNNDFYCLKDGSTSSYTNFKYAYSNGEMTKTANGDGTYHYRVEFTAGTAVTTGADGNWGSVADATGEYTIRFDNDVYNANETVNVKNFRIYESTNVDISKNDGYDRAGNPTYCIALQDSGNVIADNLNAAQYATIKEGKVFINRSWSRKPSTNHVRQLAIAPINLSATNTTLTVNGRSRGAHLISVADCTLYGGQQTTYNNTNNGMLYMGEGICFKGSDLYMLNEGSSWYYNGATSNNVCPEPIDVIWKFNITRTNGGDIITNLNAKLGSTGKYTVNFETYSTKGFDINYVNATATKPTDYILLLDASASIGGNSDTACYKRWPNYLSLENAGGSGAGDRPSSETEKTGGQIYYQHSDGEYYKFNVRIQTAGGSGSNRAEYVWLYYTTSGGTTYWYKPNDTTNVDSGGVFQTTKPTANETRKVKGWNDGDRAGKDIYKGDHYTILDAGDGNTSRLETLRNIATNLTYKIAADSQSTGLAHRIAVCQYGSGTGADGSDNTGLYTNSSTSLVGYGSISAANYQNAFYSVNNFATVRSILHNLPTSSSNTYTYAGRGFEVVNGIINNHTGGYYNGGDRNVCVIHITDCGIGDVGKTDSMANNAIAQSFAAKSHGARVYTVQVHNGNAISGFNFSTYAKAVSSNYPEAASLNALGSEKNTKYVVTVPSAKANYNPRTIAQGIVTATAADRNTEPVRPSFTITQKLSDTFNIPDNPTITVKYAKATKADGVGNVVFGTAVAASGVNASYDKNTRILTITGYNYSDQYINPGHLGNKLIVSIEGATINANSTGGNNSIGYDDSSITNNNANKTTTTPTDNTATIPEEKYVLDFGIDMNIATSDVVGVDANGVNPVSSSTSGSANLAAGSGVAKLSLNSNTGTKVNSGYMLIGNNTDGYKWKKITVVPASNILFEDTHINTKDTSGNVAWGTASGGQASSGQSVSRDTAFGYDTAYDNTNAYSNGSALTATVSSGAKKSHKATFTFTGNRFDLISACDNNTGILVVSVKQNGNLVKSYIVDTFYNGGKLNQTPVVSWSGDHGTYTVEVTAAYMSFADALKSQGGIELNSVESKETAKPTAKELLAQVGMEELANEDIELVWMDDSSILNGGAGAEGAGGIKTQGTVTELVNYIDGFRVYNPLSKDEQAKYYPESEQNAKYINIIDSIKNSGEISGTPSSWVGCVGIGSDGQFSYQNYKSSGGPNSEVYLKGTSGNRMAFSFRVNSANAKIMLSVRAVSGTPVLNINGKTYTIKHGTEMYYDITEAIGSKVAGKVTVSISNAGDANSILAVNNIKLVDAETANLSENSLDTVLDLMSMPETPVDLKAYTLNSARPSQPTDPEDPTDPTDPTEPDEPTNDGNTKNPYLQQIEQIINRVISVFKAVANLLKNAFAGLGSIFDKI